MRVKDRARRDSRTVANSWSGAGAANAAAISPTQPLSIALSSTTLFVQGRYYGELERSKQARFRARPSAARLDTTAGLGAIRRLRPWRRFAGRVMTFLRDLRHRLEYAGFRLFRAGILALPLEAASRGSGMASAPDRSPPPPSEAGPQQSGPRLSDMPLEERERIAAAMWENLGRTFAEGFFLNQIMAEGRVTYEPMEQLREIARGGPCIVCGLHLGNWELVAYASKLMGAPFTGVYQRLSNPYVDAATLKMREAVYEGGLLPRTTATARALLKTAKKGGYPAFLADLRDDRGALVPFFGVPARSTVFPALLARTTGLPSTPAPRSAAPMSISSSAERAYRSPRPTIARPTPSSPPPRYRSSSKPSSARRPSSGCGRTGSGTRASEADIRKYSGYSRRPVRRGAAARGRAAVHVGLDQDACKRSAELITGLLTGASAPALSAF